MSRDEFCAHECAPYPEFVAEANRVYEVIDSRATRGLPTDGMVDKVERRLYAPFEPAGRATARHELAHVLLSPDRWPKQRISPGYLAAVEDARINLALRAMGLPVDMDEDGVERVVELGREDLLRQDEGLLQWALRTTAASGTNASRPLLELASQRARADESAPTEFDIRLTRAAALVRQVMTRLERARRCSNDVAASFEQGRRAARWLRRRLLALGLVEPPGGLVCWVCCGGTEDEDGTGRTLTSARRRARPGHGKPGTMSIARPALAHACSEVPGRTGRRMRAHAEGVVIGDVGRFHHDQRIFRRPKRHIGRGGSALIDVSSSMSLEAGDIDRIVSGAPEATLVAIYSGRGDSGELRVVVERGRRADVSELEPFGPGNIVDIPALEWLARMPAPRVWISDGAVTGRGDVSAAGLRAAAQRICRRARIERVPDVDSAVRHLGG